MYGAYVSYATVPPYSSTFMKKGNSCIKSVNEIIITHEVQEFFAITLLLATNQQTIVSDYNLLYNISFQ